MTDLDQRVKIYDLGLTSHLATPLIAYRLSKALKDIPPSFVVIKLWSSILATAMVEKRSRQHVFNYCEDLDPSDHVQYIRFGRLKQFLVKQIFRRCSYLTANTNSVAASMREVYRLAETPDVISSVVDQAMVLSRSRDSAAVRLPHQSEDAVLRVCSVGSLIERKGLKVTQVALRELSKRHRVEWHIVGVGPLAADLGWQSSRLSVFLHGGLANPYGIMADCDVLVHSATSEAFGIVILESLAVGVPVISANAIGPQEMSQTLGEAPNMLSLYSVGDSADLLSKLNVFLESERPSLEDTTRYSSQYSLESTAARWIDRAEKLGGVGIHV